MKMRYNSQLDMEIPPLGFGIMRLPMKGDLVDESCFNLIDKAMQNGIVYFDTAYPYQRGKSEEFIREALVKRYPRNSFYIADKMPIYLVNSKDDFQFFFDAQLDRLGTDYIDFYLMHNINNDRWHKVYNLGIVDFLEDKKREGKIRKVGFSIHDKSIVLESVLNAYKWDFAQLQINYFDWEIQDTKKSYNILKNRNIPCFVMEPVGGGRLAKLPSNSEKMLKQIRTNDSIASWAIRFCSSLSNVAICLSGMQNESMILDNISVFNPFTLLCEKEYRAIDLVVKDLQSYNIVKCTYCGYCIDNCPQNIDIPLIFLKYNDYKVFEKTSNDFATEYFGFVSKLRRADNCIECNKCRKCCPQGIDISSNLKRIHKKAISIHCDVDVFSLEKRLKDIGQKELIIFFGAGYNGAFLSKYLKSINIYPDYFVDNNPDKWEQCINGVKIISANQLVELSKSKKMLVIITSTAKKEIEKQLISMGIASIK